MIIRSMKSYLCFNERLKKKIFGGKRSTSPPMSVAYRKRVSIGWWLLLLSAKISALLRLLVTFFQLRSTKKLKINFLCFKELNINKPVFSLSSKQNKGLRIISGNK